MSAFSLNKTVTIVVGQSTSDKFPTGEFQGGSFYCPAVVTGTINFEVSNDGTNWDSLSNAAATFADIAAPAVNKPRALPTNLFEFMFARFKANANQAAADASIVVSMYGY